MCGRFSASLDAEGLSQLFDVDDVQSEELPPRWNIPPTLPVYAITEHEQRRVLVNFTWGLVPHWAKDPSVGAKMINARSETVGEKPAFRDSFVKRRCLIPADGFFEWQKLADKQRIPHFVQRTDGAPMAFAGLWSVWRPKDDPNAERLLTCTILTTSANDRLSAIHERMPVILERDAWATWLDRSVQDKAQLTDLLHPSASDAVTAHRVATDVGNVRNNHPGLLEPVDT